jgi:DNA mismatch repair protein MutL
MAHIRILSPDVRGKIAAGEVIIRPASVVKELLENSLDARAGIIEVEIINGGKDKCLVNDNGEGMGREDAQLALERYATSKISSIEDIENIDTFGFRGEALASIAYVSKFEMETSNGTIGTRIVTEGGVLKGVFDSERPHGTRVKASSLFYNLPARRKFLKSAAWERHLIIEIIKAYAVIFPQAAFILADAGRSIMNLPPVDSEQKRIKAMMPTATTEYLINVDFQLGTTRIRGVLSRPDLEITHRLKNIYVNSRPVRYPRVYRTVLEAYGNPKNPPVFAINIQTEPHLVDVNIHPAKSEVKFKDERYILDLLGQAIKREVFKKSVAVDYDFDKHSTQRTHAVSGRFIQDVVIPYSAESAERVPGSEEFWQLHDTYILAQTKSGLIIIDQHVAHERVIYEAIMKGRVQSQRLLFPITIELTPEEYQVYEKTKHTLKEMGIEFKEFSSNTVVIDSLPADFRVNREEIRGLFAELVELGDLLDEKGKVARVLACRGAIKAGQTLSTPEMQALIDRLFATDNPYTCPHGRPIVIRWTLEELAHRFGRS